MDGTDSRNENLDIVRERLNVVTQETRFSLVQDILGHPSGLPTLKELNYANPNRSQTTIRQHLQQLVEAGIVEKVELPEDRRQNDLPYTFYGLSEEGVASLRSTSCCARRRPFRRSTTGSRKPPMLSGTSQPRVPKGE